VFFVKDFQPMAWGGIASFGTLRARIKGLYALTQGNLPHEVGHGFNLLHTFTCTSTNTGFDATCAENPYNPSFECTTRGDKVCDTPADYNPLATTIQNSNNPYGLNNYNPDQTNIMSYWPNKDHFTAGQGERMRNAIANAYQLQSIRAYQCAEIAGPNIICPKDNFTYSFPANGASLTYSWSVSGMMQIIGPTNSPTVTIKGYYPWQGPITSSTVTLVINGTITKTKTVRQCYIRRPIGVYDWVSIDSGNMGLIIPINSEEEPIASYLWEITEDSNVTSTCNGSKAYFVGGATNEPNKFSSTSNQAVVNWGSCSKSYLITCYAISELGEQVLISKDYVDVGDPKNNPCYKDAITTTVAPNPIQNGIINVVLNKPSHSTPCNYKDLNEPQYFNSELDQINNSVSIFDYNGTEVYRKVFETNQFVIDDANLISGNNYIVNLYTNESGFTQQVIIVQ
jgi:Pregnancy-associated plasma protein-A